jgi:hypothetical protein
MLLLLCFDGRFSIGWDDLPQDTVIVPDSASYPNLAKEL